MHFSYHQTFILCSYVAACQTFCTQLHAHILMIMHTHTQSDRTQTVRCAQTLYAHQVYNIEIPAVHAILNILWHQPCKHGIKIARLLYNVSLLSVRVHEHSG